MCFRMSLSVLCDSIEQMSESKRAKQAAMHKTEPKRRRRQRVAPEPTHVQDIAEQISSFLHQRRVGCLVENAHGRVRDTIKHNAKVRR